VAADFCTEFDHYVDETTDTCVAYTCKFLINTLDSLLGEIDVKYVDLLAARPAVDDAKADQDQWAIDEQDRLATQRQDQIDQVQSLRIDYKAKEDEEFNRDQELK
jgi:hypothetical protein